MFSKYLREPKVIVAAVVILAVLGIWVAAQMGSIRTAEEQNNETATSTATSTKQATSTPTSTLPAVKKDTGGTHLGLTYGEAVKIYENRRIQFDESCVAIPASIVLKNGTSVMFDNRFKEGRYFSLDGMRYYLRAYDFRILTLRSPDLPHTITVDCGNGRNNGKIILN